MIVSGLTIESKKITNTKKGLPPKDTTNLRPSSHELPEIYEPRALTTSKFGYHSNKLPLEHSLPKPQNKIKTASKGQYSSENHIQLKKRDSREKKQIKEIKEAIKKTKKIEINRSEADECLYDNQQGLMAFYRYSPITVIAASAMKDDLMKGLAQKGDFCPAGPKIKRKKGMQPIWQKLTKMAMLKGKYKYRQKFNFIYSAQLKALNYKRKQYKKRKQSQSSSSDDETEKKQKCRDLQTWKKSMGVEDCKVFIIKGKYRDLKNALLQRGWVQNQDKHSQLYDLKWTTKVSDVNFQSLRPHQLVNHFNNNACLTSKYGLIKSLRSIMLSESIDVDRFFPKCFDMSDLQDFQNFHEVYKWVYAVSILKNAIESAEQPKDLTRIAIALIVTLRRLFSADKMLSGITNGRYNLCSIEQWKFLTNAKGAQEPTASLMEWDFMKLEWQHLKLKIIQTLQKLSEADPQNYLDGKDNIWIVKPAFLSRGRGIKCLSDLTDVLDYSLGKETQYVVQKYIENPLLIKGRKFDIRQWVIVQDYNPPRIWFYTEYYVRFCLQNYDPKKLNNRFMHLTNNSVQKNNQKVTSAALQGESMWTMQQMKQYLLEQYNDEAIHKELIQKIRQIVVATIVATQDQVYGRRKSFQLIGYDFMIDDQLNPWLIEVNSSPSMDYSTQVTRKLVKMVLEDTVKVMIDPYKKKTKKKGLFRLIYDGETPYEFKRYKMSSKQNK